MTEEHKAKLKEAREVARAKKADNFVSKESFEQFQSSNDDKLNKIVGVLETLVNQKEPERRVMTVGAEKKTDAGNVSNSPSNEEVIHNLDSIAPEYQEIFEKYFEMSDGFKGMLKGVNFKIEVPLHLSNVQDAHKTFYKRDIRHKVLDSHDIEGSIEKYCKLVANEMHYNRKIALRI